MEGSGIFLKPPFWDFRDEGQAEPKMRITTILLYIDRCIVQVTGYKLQVFRWCGSAYSNEVVNIVFSTIAVVFVVFVRRTDETA